MRPPAALLLAASLAHAASGQPVQVGSKQFTEGVILGELATQLARSARADAVHRSQLGGTQILWKALQTGAIDVYAEYTGTIAEEILAGRGIHGEAAVREALAAQGIAMTRPLGFNNTYALGMKQAAAARLGIRRISDLRAHPSLRVGFSNEFMDRGDGWPKLKERYGLPLADVRGLDHALAYRGLDEGTVDLTDLYSTDAEIQAYGITVLEDDLRHFPAYQALFLYRAELERTRPGVVAALRRLEGRIDEAAMVRMNARAKIDKVPEAEVAADFLGATVGAVADVAREGWLEALARHTRAHLFLVVTSLAAAIAVAIPLGVACIFWPRLGQLVLAAVGIVQTLPSLALLVFMIPLLGIGWKPAVAALFLYSLLPIVRNTHAGLASIPPALSESAEALGLPRLARLRLVELPMASRAILAGIKTSAVINVGTATIGALVGAEGYGQPILTGIRLDDLGLILQGAVPAALMALLAQGGFDLLERVLVPRGLRLA